MLARHAALRALLPLPLPSAAARRFAGGGTLIAAALLGALFCPSLSARSNLLLPALAGGGWAFTTRHALAAFACGGSEAAEDMA